MTTDDVDDPPTIDDVITTLRRQVAASPQDIQAHIELADALVERADVDETRAPVATDADEPIELLKVAVELAADEHPEVRATILVDLGQKLTWRFQALLEDGGTPEDQLQLPLGEAISCLQQALKSAAEAGVTDQFISIELEAVLQLVDLLRLRFNGLGELDDLSAAIGYEQQILGVLTAVDEDRAEVLYQLGVDFAARHDQQTETAPDDLDQAITCLHELRELIGDDHSGRPELATRLGLMLAYRVLHAVAESSDEDFAEAVEELTLARGALTTAEDSADSWLVRFRLGMVRAFRYLNQGGDAADRDVAVAELSALTSHPDTSTEQADGCHLTLALLHYLRTAPAGLRRGPELLNADGPARLRDMIASLGTGNGADTAHAVRRHLDAMSESAAADPQLSMLVRGLRAGTLTHHGTKGDDVSTAELNDAVKWLDDATPEFADCGVANELAILKSGLRAELTHRSGDRAGAAAATDLVTEAVAALDPDHPLRAVMHNLLGALVGTIGPADSADESSTRLATMERLLTELPDDHPDRARALTKASALLFNGMTLNRPAVSFDMVREMLNRAIERPAADDVNDSLNHFMLGVLNGFQGVIEHDMDLIDSGVGLLKKAIEAAPEGHQLRGMIGPGLGGLFYGRALLGGDLENYDAAEFYSGYAELAPVDEDPESTRLRHTMRALGDYLAASAKLARNRHNLDPVLLDQTIEKMTAAIEILPEDHYLRGEISANIDALLLVQNGHGLAVDRDVDLTSVNPEILRVHVEPLLAKAAHAPEERFDHAFDTGIAAMALVGPAFLARDRHSLDRGISMLAGVCATRELSAQERLSALGCLSMSLRMRYQLFRRPRDLNNAIDRLEQAELLIQQSPPDGADTAPILNLLGDCYHERADPHRRDRQRAVEAGLQALRERANDVLLQNNSERAVDTAIAASGEAADVARWCLAAGRNETAVQALELGRAIVLHFATIDAGIPELLRQGGYPALATEWEAASNRTSRTGELPWNLGRDERDAKGQDRRARAAAELMANLGSGKVAIPSDLRHRVVEAVEGTETYGRLLDPPSVADITAALAATESSALIYLLPADEGRPGLAMIVHADGTVAPRELPGLRCDADTVFDALRRAHRALQAVVPESVEEEKARQYWQARLNDVCDWAWTAAMGEVLSVLGRPQGGHPIRLILVPLGELGMVPWHAARRRVPGGERRHACQDAVITYASSARQFVDTSRRRTLPWSSTPAVVRVSSGLVFASEEIAVIHRCFYRAGTYLGAPRNRGDRATATRVRDLLPSKHSAGASLLHMGCHAAVANPPINSFLALAGDSKLYVRDMLEQARDRPVDAAGGLVILAACASDLTGGAHDEALTLATAFLAAGSVGVVGARWAVDDAPTALFMVMFHHYLNCGYHDPATALRAAQRWMLDKRRTLPKGFGRLLADQLTQLDLTETANWAAFTYQGR
ncbi:MAG: CHAT domain-containing protein [Actinomycetota bacterium]|nr:CHAT domain-containing protein [Actinomycetota bacterium]